MGYDPSTSSAPSAEPGLHTPELREPVARPLCTDCGVSRMADPSACGKACQFIAPDYPAREMAAHGRARRFDMPDELRFGVFQKMHRARLKAPSEGAQWTGITTAIGEALLKSGKVEGVLTVRATEGDPWRPEPVLVTEAQAMAQTRGMRMGYAPTLALLEEAAARGLRKLAMIGIPCQVHALRALEAELGLGQLFVIGTPCSDNTTTENFELFLELLTDEPDTVTYLEFCPDYHVEMRFRDGRKRRIPFLHLPISQLPSDFFPLTCRTCVDYPNALADIVVGYMGGDGDQWVIVRNDRGQAMLDQLGDAVALDCLTEKGKRASAVKGFITNTERAAGGLPLRAMPNWARPIAAFLMPIIGPRGLEFARARIDMKASETILHLRAALPAKMKNMIPAHVWGAAADYALDPQAGETREQGVDPASSNNEDRTL